MGSQSGLSKDTLQKHRGVLSLVAICVVRQRFIFHSYEKFPRGIPVKDENMSFYVHESRAYEFLCP